MRIAIPLIALVGVISPAMAQDHSGHAQVPDLQPLTPQMEAMDHQVMDHGQMDHSQHQGHQMPAPSAADIPHQETPPEPAMSGPAHAADAIWGAEAMDASRKQMLKENGGSAVTAILIDRREIRLGKDNGALWDVQAYRGSDSDKLWIKTEGEVVFGEGFKKAEAQALWSHAIAPFFDLQAGIRYDFEPDHRAHAVIGVQGLAPYMIHLDAAAFLSDKGDLTARIEAEHDMLITQRLVLQPRVEVELSAQDIPERHTASGLTHIETGLRLRYEFSRKFAPYVGVEYSSDLGDSADMARAAGEDASGGVFVAGIKAIF